MRNGLIAMTLLAACWCGAYAGELDRLIQGVQQPDTPAQVEARQLLPRHGVDAIPMLLPLLDHDDARVSWTANRILEDICNETAKPGGGADARMNAAQALLPALATGRPVFTRRAGLELLGIVAPAGFDVQPVAALLEDEVLGQRARYALQTIGTPEACAALRNALASANNDLVYGVLDSLEKLRDGESVPAIKNLFAHADADVRSAALRAVAWTGDVALAPEFESVMDQATDESQFEAYDAYLSLANAIAQAGGNNEYAARLFAEILANAPGPIIQAGAMTGLGNYGDERAVPVLVAAAQANPELEDALTPALEYLRGRAAANAIAAAYPDLSHSSKYHALQMFARRQDDPLVDVLLAELNAEDAVLRDAARNGLIAAGRIEVMPVLIEQAKAGGESRTAAVDTMMQLARSMGVKGNANGAGQVYRTSLEMAENNETKAACLDGIAQYPVSGAYDLVRAAAENADLKARAVPALIAVSTALSKEEQGDKAVEALRFAMGLDPSPEALQRITGQLQQLQDQSAAQAAMGFIREWKVIGPFDWESDETWNQTFIGEPEVNFANEITSNDTALAWKEVNADNSTAHVNLIAVIGQRDRAFAYAYAEVTSPKAQPAELRIGSDDGVRAWVNGEQVHDNNVDRGAALDQDIVGINLTEGVNTMLLRISQGAGGWGFMARLTGPGGAPLEFTQE